MSGADTYDVTIAEIRRNATEKVVVRRGVFRGGTRVDVRLFGDYHDVGEFRPTKKGLSVSAGQLSELISALQRAQEQLPQEKEVSAS